MSECTVIEPANLGWLDKMVRSVAPFSVIISRTLTIHSANWHPRNTSRVYNLPLQVLSSFGVYWLIAALKIHHYMHEVKELRRNLAALRI